MSRIIDDLKLQYKMGGVVIRLIFLNIFFFAVPAVLFSVLQLFKVDVDYISYVSLSTDWSLLVVKPWSILSYAFFHSGFFHILFNMLMLNFFGTLFLTYFTQKQLLGLYILAALFSGIIYMIGYSFLPALTGVNASMIGASGAIMAVLLATVTYQPFMEVRLFLFGNVKLWQIASVLVVLDLIQLPMDNTGGHIAHLAGAVFGAFYIKVLQSGTDLSNIVTNIINFFVNLFQPSKSKPFKKVHVNPKKPGVNAQSKIVTKDKSQQQIDEILDKISQSGYDSLTAQEKEFLFKAGK
jgi:membrane associated rhomboid family serine protease